MSLTVWYAFRDGRLFMSLKGHPNKLIHKGPAFKFFIFYAQFEVFFIEIRDIALIIASMLYM